MLLTEPDNAAIHDQFVGVIEPLRGALLDVVLFASGERAERGYEAEGGSPGAADEANEPPFSATFSGRPALDARHLGSLQLLAAEDHIGALCRLIVMKEPVLYADRVLARSAIEASARARWLLDPAIDTRTRVCRGVNERLFSIFAEGLLTGSRNRTREGELLTAARRHGFTVQTPKKGAAFLHPARPDATKGMNLLFDRSELVKQNLELGAMSQRYLSMFVHATTGGLLAVRQLGGEREVGDGVVSIPLVSDARQLNSLLALVATGYLAAANGLRQTMGWQDGAWVKLSVNLMAIIRQTV